MYLDKTINFVNVVASYLYEEGKAKLQCFGRGIVVATGVLKIPTDVGDADAEVEVDIKDKSWIIDAPCVRAHAAWLRPKEPCAYVDYCDWHRYPSGELCWIRPDDWQTATSKMENVDDVRRAAATLAKNVQSLLRYHFIGYVLGLSSWQKDWDARPHGSYERK